MRQRKMNVTLTMAAIGSLGAVALVAGCNAGGSTDEGTTGEAALKAASPACVSARDACKTSFESIASGIQTACTTPDACKAAFDAAKPALEAAAKACETSIKAACVVDFGGDGGPGAPGGNNGHGAFGGDSGRGAFGGNSGRGAFGGNSGRGAIGGGSGNNTHDGGLPGHGESAACEAAEMTCRQALQSLLSMPPAACAAIPMACADRTSMAPTDGCKTAISDCKTALTAAGAGTHDTCGSAIVTACGGHTR